MKSGRAAPKGPDLFLEERRSRIGELIEERERATVQELAAHFGVSAVTIRSDLDALARAGGVVRSHGGAMRREMVEDIPLVLKQALHRGEKVRIAQTAAGLIRDGETIILDSGTTTAGIASRIGRLRLRSLTVITNALNIAAALADLAHVRLIMIGGLLRQVSSSLVGPQAEQVLRGLHADKLFLGVDSLDPEIGLMTPDVLEAQLNALMIEVSQEVIAVADASKFHRRSLSVIAPVEKIHKLITDKSASPEVVEAMRARGVEVILA
ncbi:MAG TPA: DeoR/GlpR family DNA-binding transcription regulator [Thermoanaerobaculia bacterium]